MGPIFCIYVLASVQRPPDFIKLQCISLQCTINCRQACKKGVGAILQESTCLPGEVVPWEPLVVKLGGGSTGMATSGEW